MNKQHKLVVVTVTVALKDLILKVCYVKNGRRVVVILGFDVHCLMSKLLRLTHTKATNKLSPEWSHSNKYRLFSRSPSAFLA